MMRCMKREDVRGGMTFGCVREAGLRGKCKIRTCPDAWTEEAERPRRTPRYECATVVVRPEALARVRSLGGAAAALDLELAGLGGDLKGLLAAVVDRGGAIRRRFLALRQALIKSRAQVARMRREWEGGAEADAADADEDEEEGAA